MHRARTATVALTIAAASLLAPAVAAADPWLSATTNGDTVTDVGVQGQPITLTGFGCDNSSGTAVMGEFVSQLGDPWMLGDPSTYGPGELYHFDFPVDDVGSFTWDLTIPLENDVGVFRVRWYCATRPVESLTDPAVTWVAPELTMDISPTSPPVALRSLLGMPSPRGGAGENAVTIEVDPDALPAVDRIAIPGAKAAALKGRVDARVAKLEKDRRSLAKLLWAFPSLAKGLKAPATSADYVTAAHQELTGRFPSSKALKSSVARLDDGQLKVQVVEDIALTAHDAAWWIRKA